MQYVEYFAQVASSINGEGVGLSLCYADSGQVPGVCIDIDPDDGYEGDVTVGHLGEPVAGAEVIYRKRKQKAAQTLTDAQGRRFGCLVHL